MAKKWTDIVGQKVPDWDTMPERAKRAVAAKGRMAGYPVDLVTGLVYSAEAIRLAQLRAEHEHKIGYDAGVNAAWMGGSCSALGTVSADYARGYEEGYDANWEKYDAACAAIGFEG